ncbi:Flp pilus assembly protein [Bifidobacterium sp. DSM 109957]|uniref:Flp pilus assembly protein n=2 Tax=Bifidobacterium oedipodis TaxID=2675322 RepID=A0A7Y0HT70_9BIFI|nr:Flp pilus assembly protein [Bifidobacterium sp. DSM 109957]
MLVLRMVEVALQQGVPIPRVLIVVGDAMGGATGCRIASVGVALHRGVPWREAWRSARGEALAHGDGQADDVDEALLDILDDALASSWLHGDAPTIRLQTAIEQWHKDQRAAIEQRAARLSVTLLLPTGLCFLPAFVLIGVIPIIASFMA